MNLNVKKRVSVIPDTNLRSSKTQWRYSLTKWVGAILAVSSVSSVLSIAKVQAADDCVINLNDDSHTCQSISAITFVTQPENHQAVIKINLNPESSGYTKALFEVSYGSQPTGWTVNIGDSPSNDGYGEEDDSGNSSNTAEMQINGALLDVYSNLLEGHEAETMDGDLHLWQVDNVVGQGETISLEISNEHLGWNSPRIIGEFNSEYLFTLDGQAVDYDIYAAFNRVISSSRRSGSGVKSVRVRLLPEEVSFPSVEPPPFILPTKELDALNSLTNNIRRAARDVDIPGKELSQGFSIQQPAGLSSLASPAEAAQHFLSAPSVAASLGLESTAQLKLMREKVLNGGRSVVRFQQNYQDIPIIGGEVIVQMDANKNIMAINGETSPALENLNTTPSISADIASKIALAAIAKQYQLEESELTVNEPELWIYNPAILNAPTSLLNVLVWRMEITPVKQLPIRELVLVNAHFGIVELNFNQINAALHRMIFDNNNVPPPANDPYLGLPGLPGNGPARKEGDPATGIAEVDKAYDYSKDTYDFYKTEHGRDDLGSPGTPIISTVRYCVNSTHCPFPTAFWNGFQVIYGEGFATDDVVGHELTHIVTANESKLFYFYQSGAISESFSDLWGEFIDQTNGAGNDSPEVKWLMGEDLPMRHFRNMADPTIALTHLGPDWPRQPDKMSSIHYQCPQSTLPIMTNPTGDLGDAGGVHMNSGVNNKAVYLMTDGGTFNGYTVEALGYKQVAALYYEVQTNLLTSAADYADLYDALLQACLNLHINCENVKNALDAVEMNQDPISCAAETPPICDNPDEVPVDLFFDDIESGDGKWIRGQNINSVPFSPWFVPQKDAFIGSNILNVPYASSGVGNIWGFNQGQHLPGNPTYGGISDTFLAMKSDVSSLPSNAFMHFNHSFSFESAFIGSHYFDGGLLEYSTNGGSTWIDANSLIIDNGYNGTITTQRNNPLAGQAAFVADSRGYISTRLDLSSLAEQNIRFRFRIGTDEIIYDYGWFIDDVRIYSCRKVLADICTGAVDTESQNGGGEWTEPNTWTNGVPNENRTVRINLGDVVTIAGDSSLLKVKGLCNYGTLEEINNQLLYLKAEPTVGFIYNAATGNILGHNDQDRPIFSPQDAPPAITSLRSNIGTDGSSIKLDVGNQFENMGTIQAGHGRAGYLQGGEGGSVEVYGHNITHSNGTIAAGNGGEGNALQLDWDGKVDALSYGDQPVNGGNGGRTILHASNSITSTALATTSSGIGGNAYVWCGEGNHLVGPYYWDDWRWMSEACVDDNTDIPLSIAEGGLGGDLIHLSPSLNLNSMASSGQEVYSVVGYTISGTISDKQAIPIEGVTVKVGEKTAVSNDTGYWEIAGLPKGEYSLIASKDNSIFAPKNLVVEGDSPVIEVDIDVVTPASCLLYAVNDGKRNSSQFFTMSFDEPQEINELGPVYKGYDIEALAIHPETNMICAASGDDVNNGKKGHFYIVDGETGDLFPVGSTGFNEIEDLTFSSDGTLWAWAKGSGLITIEPTTGVGTLKVPYGKPLIEGLTLKKNDSNIFFGTVKTELWRYDMEADNLEVICQNKLIGETEALEMMPNGQLLIGTHKAPFIYALTQTCDVIMADKMLTNQFDDVEGIAVPVAACPVE